MAKSFSLFWSSPTLWQEYAANISIVPSAPPFPNLVYVIKNAFNYPDYKPKIIEYTNTLQSASSSTRLESLFRIVKFGFQSQKKNYYINFHNLYSSIKFLVKSDSELS